MMSMFTQHNWQRKGVNTASYSVCSMFPANISGERFSYEGKDIKGMRGRSLCGD